MGTLYCKGTWINYSLVYALSVNAYNCTNNEGMNKLKVDEWMIYSAILHFKTDYSSFNVCNLDYVLVFKFFKETQTPCGGGGL